MAKKKSKTSYDASDVVSPKWADRLLTHVGSFSNEGKSYSYAQFSLCVSLERMADK